MTPEQKERLEYFRSKPVVKQESVEAPIHFQHSHFIGTYGMDLCACLVYCPACPRPLSQRDEWLRTRRDIVSECVCVSDDDRECIRARYETRRPHPEDFDYFDRMDEDEMLDERCECVCHRDLAQAEEEIFGDYR